MANNRPLLRTRLGAVVASVLAVGLGLGLGSGVSHAAPQPVLAEATRVEQPAAATARAQRLNVDPSKPIFPMQTTPRCAILDNFGAARSGGRSHQGTDMLATLDQEVYAVVDGTLSHQVVDGGADSTLSGNAWRLVASGTSATYYAYMHLSRFADGLTNGSSVIQGQLIGYVGDTGNPGPGNYHLHFEVHPKAGAAIDALTVLTVPPACNVLSNAG